MSTYRFRVTRKYVMDEEADVVVEADTIEVALARAKQEDVHEGLDWMETDGGADPDTYEWFEWDTDKLVGTGTNDWIEE